MMAEGTVYYLKTVPDLDGSWLELRKRDGLFELCRLVVDSRTGEENRVERLLLSRDDIPKLIAKLNRCEELFDEVFENSAEEQSNGDHRTQ